MSFPFKEKLTSCSTVSVCGMCQFGIQSEISSEWHSPNPVRLFDLPYFVILTATIILSVLRKNKRLTELTRSVHLYIIVFTICILHVLYCIGQHHWEKKFFFIQTEIPDRMSCQLHFSSIHRLQHLCFSTRYVENNSNFKLWIHT